MNVGNVSKMHGFAGAPLQYEVFQSIDRITSAQRKAVAPPPDVDRAARNILSPAELLGHLGNLDAEFGSAQWIKLDVDFVHAAVGIDLNGPDAGNGFQPRNHGFFQKTDI